MEFPTAWQRKMMWGALATLSVVMIGAIAVGLVWLASSVIAFLQPFLIPFAIAGVMAYLLDPVVSKIVVWGTSRQRAVFSVFAAVTVSLVGAMLWIIPAVWTQTGNLVQKVPAYRDRLIKRVDLINDWERSFETKYGLKLLPQIPEKIQDPLELSVAEPATGVPSAVVAGQVPVPAPAPVRQAPAVTGLPEYLRGDWMRNLSLPGILRGTSSIIKNSVGGVIGFVLSMVIVPIYLYYLLIESKNISEFWGDYVPLRASAFKDEVVSVLNEINGYLIAFFRGQLLVSMINGSVTAIGLASVGLDFGLLIGLMLCLLGLIPYLGIILCWVPAVIIASVQGGSWLIPASPWYLFPLVVTGIFTLVQQVDGLFVTPKIVGESVGLHPLTVIVSVFVWSLLLGGLLGAILAVPLTATIKVLLRRYIWQRKLFAEPIMLTEESFALQQARDGMPPDAPPVEG